MGCRRGRQQILGWPQVSDRSSPSWQLTFVLWCSSWGTYWGESGFFKIVRGKDNLKIGVLCIFNHSFLMLLLLQSLNALGLCLPRTGQAQTLFLASTTKSTKVKATLIAFLDTLHFAYQSIFLLCRLWTGDCSQQVARA